MILKPVVIIVLAVACSVIVIGGIFFAIGVYEAYQYEQAAKLYDFENVVVPELVEIAIDAMKECFDKGGYRDCLDETVYAYPIFFDGEAELLGYDGSNYMQHKADVVDSITALYHDCVVQWQSSGLTYYQYESYLESNEYDPRC